MVRSMYSASGVQRVPKPHRVKRCPLITCRFCSTGYAVPLIHIPISLNYVFVDSITKSSSQNLAQVVS